MPHQISVDVFHRTGRSETKGIRKATCCNTVDAAQWRFKAAYRGKLSSTLHLSKYSYLLVLAVAFHIDDLMIAQAPFMMGGFHLLSRVPTTTTPCHPHSVLAEVSYEHGKLGSAQESRKESKAMEESRWVWTSLSPWGS